jgi:F0F1-type ATP synthase assembly protein I
MIGASTMTFAIIPHMPDLPPRDQRSWLAGMGAAWMMITSVAMGIGLGLALDRWLDSSPWGTLVLSMTFLAAGVYLVIREGSR